jgi:hypothetical protein
MWNELKTAACCRLSEPANPLPHDIQSTWGWGRELSRNLRSCERKTSEKHSVNQRRLRLLSIESYRIQLKRDGSKPAVRTLSINYVCHTSQSLNRH